jgi:hypothetical protein
MATYLTCRAETDRMSSISNVFQKDGSFDRPQSAFRNTISAKSGAQYPPEKGRYHLYVSYACPWGKRHWLHRLDLAQLLLCPFGCSRCRLPGMPPRTVCRASSEISPETLCPSEHAPRISHSGWSERHTDIHFPAHRTLIVRKLKGLEEFISFSNVHYLMSMTTGRSTAFSRGNKGGQVTPVVVLTNSAHFPSLRLALPNCRRDLTRRERNA